MSKRKRPVRRQRPLTLPVLAGVVLVLVAVFAAKNGKEATASSTPLESQLDQALKDGRPTFVFLHSLDCIPCREMMGVVSQVHPEFREAVILIDVDVYDRRNVNILRRERLQSIPTLVFYDALGNRRVHIGVMPPDQFRDTLTELVAGT